MAQFVMCTLRLSTSMVVFPHVGVRVPPTSAADGLVCLSLHVGSKRLHTQLFLTLDICVCV